MEIDLNTLIFIFGIIVILILVFQSQNKEKYDPDPQIVYADYRMIPEFPTADHFASSKWPRYDLTSDHDPFSPYYPYYGTPPYFEGGQ